MGLAVCEVSWLFEISQIFVVHCDSYWMFHSSEIMSPFLEGLDNSEKFPIIDVIVLLSWGKGGRMVSARIKVSVGILLHEYPSGGSEGGVSHDEERFRDVWHLDYWC